MRPRTRPLERPRDPIVAEPPAGPAEIEQLASRFEPAARREVRRLVRSSSRLADLAAVFPAAIYALAIRSNSAVKRREALTLVEEGAPLRSVAATLELPLWLRRLPPEAFAGPLQGLPSSDSFSRRVANLMPVQPSESAFWLASVAFANKAAHEDFALWLAQQQIFGEAGDPARLFTVLAAYAWFSGAFLSRAHDLIVVPWRPEMAFDTALCAAKSWFNRLRLVVQLDAGVLTDSWLAGGTSGAYSFVPLLDQRDILAEAHAMQNCADQYADRLVRDRCRLFSIRHNGARVATLEIGSHPRETGVLTISQLKARHNMPAPVEVWQAAHGWLATQRALKRLPSMVVPDRPPDTRAWQQLMLPYRRVKTGATWVPAATSSSTFAALDADMADLARRGGVTSWLFT